MLHSGRFTAILDANVLYPAPLRDHLLSLADSGLYTPKWSDDIQDEWIRNVLAHRSDLNAKQLYRTSDLMNTAFPDAKVNGYKNIIAGLEMPDQDDRHVLAAAIRCQAEVIVTSNLKDFPPDYLATFDIEAQGPDQFICNIIDIDPTKALDALYTQVNRLKNPPRSVVEVLETLANNGIPHASLIYQDLL